MSAEEMPDMKLAFNKGYTPNGFAEKVYHLHVRHYGDWGELYFRDYLAAHSEAAAEYGTLKVDLLKENKYNRDGYTDAKSDFIIKHTEKARQEFGARYAPVKQL